MLEFYFMFNDGSVKTTKATSRIKAYDNLYLPVLWEFEDFNDFIESINFVEWLDENGIRNYHDCNLNKTNQDNLPLTLKNYLNIEEVKLDENVLISMKPR